MVKDLRELRNLIDHQEISFIRIKEEEDLLKCEAFSTTGYVGNCVLRNKIVIEKVKHHAKINKIKGSEIDTLIKHVARLHLKLKSSGVKE